MKESEYLKVTQMNYLNYNLGYNFFMIKLGSHVSFKAPDYLKGASDVSISYGSNAMMFYLGAPQNARRVDVDKYLIDEYKASTEKIEVENMVIHAPYIVNPASMEKFGFAIDFLTKEIERMNFIGIKYMVLHPGAATKFDVNDSIERLVKSLKEIIANTTDVTILLETMAGKGTELGATFEQMNEIISKVGSDRVGVCLDTCHVWEAGYDIKDYPGFIKELKKHNLLDLVKVIHINDSKNERGAHKDRHENIGKGFIGTEALKPFIQGKEFKDIIKVLETPWIDGEAPYKEEIELLLK